MFRDKRIEFTYDERKELYAIVKEHEAGIRDAILALQEIGEYNKVKHIYQREIETCRVLLEKLR